MINPGLDWRQAGPTQVRAPTPTPAHPAAKPSIVGQIGWLQATAGNAAVAQLLTSPAARQRGFTPIIQRCGSIPPDECGCHGASGSEPVQRSPRSTATAQRGGPPTAGDVPLLPTAPKTIVQGIPGLPSVRIGKGTKASPKLKQPGDCRGACGAGCPSSCKPQQTYVRTYIVGNAEYDVEFPNPILCRTHQGCQDHDECFNQCVQGGEDSMVGACHNRCSAAATARWGVQNTVQWMFGYGPAEDWWWFVDQPVIVDKRPIASEAQHAAIDSLALPSLADAIVARARTEYETAGPDQEQRWLTFYQSAQRNRGGFPDSHEVARELYQKMLAAEQKNDGGKTVLDHVTMNLSPRDTEPAWRTFESCDWLARPLGELVDKVTLALPKGGRGIQRVNVVFGKPGQCGGPLRVPVTSTEEIRKAVLGF